MHSSPGALEIMSSPRIVQVKKLERKTWSVVVMVYLCPVGDQVLSLRLAGWEAHASFVAVCLADPHPPVLWHDAIVDSPLEEPKLARCG